MRACKVNRISGVKVDVSKPISEKRGRLKPIGRRFSVSARWHIVCECECGKVVTVQERHLDDGASKSCGCITVERKTVHGLSHTAEYRPWVHMMERCNNPAHHAFADYGGRGVTVCPQWNSIEQFIKDMGPRPSRDYSIDRIDNNGNYEPGNCRWATRIVQCNNKRNNVLITLGDTTLNVTQWSKISKISRFHIYRRLLGGWPSHLAVWAPMGSRLKNLLNN